jgi:putative alpha-1,2-mannosidase
MIPFNVRGLIEAMGGPAPFNARLDAFFKHPDGGWALTGSGGLHAEMDNEPSVGAPWLYLFSGRPQQAQQTVRQVVNTLWNDTPDGIPGNDDLGAMSSWYVFAALGMYPAYPGRAELLLTSPLFPQVTITRAQGASIAIRAPQANASTPYIAGLRVNGRPRAKAWLPESFVADGGTLDYRLSPSPHPSWGAEPPPSFSPESP